MVKEAANFREDCCNNEKGGYNWLAIGNSITLSRYTNYWWSLAGMAASEVKKDYFHQIKLFLEKNRNLCCIAYNFAKWEMMDTDRAETLDMLDDYLNNYLNLVTIQLGENIFNYETFEEDFRFLLRHVKKVSFKAQIIVIGDFWERNGNGDEIKHRVSEQCGVDFADISLIKGREEYQCGLGTIVYGDDGRKHLVEHEGVAMHPNDQGMEYIAKKVESLIRPLINVF